MESPKVSSNGSSYADDYELPSYKSPWEACLAEVDRIRAIDKLGYPYGLKLDEGDVVMYDDEDFEQEEIDVIINEIPWHLLGKGLYSQCSYCHREGHNMDNCHALKNMRCNYCGDFGHTGNHCKTKTVGQEVITYRC
jgi:hypothetical protein